MHSDETRTDQRGLPASTTGADVAAEAQLKATRQTRRIDEDEQGQRLDNYLARHLHEFPKSYIFKIIRSGEVRLNGAKVTPEQRIQGGDQLRLPPKAEHAFGLTSGQSNRPQPGGKASSLVHAQARQVNQQIPVVYEDEALLVVNKPFGLAVHGGSGVSLGVIESLRLARPELKFLELAHRLDKETSGLLILAKKRVALVKLQEQFRERNTRKVYQAVVFGKVPRREKTIRLSLSRDPETASGDRRVRVDPLGQEAVSIVKGLNHAILADDDVLSRVAVAIETGRTHQIRVHLASSGFPILGDPKYGDFARNRKLQALGFKRMYLHAWRLTFRHPVTAATMPLEAPLPADFAQLVAHAAPASQAGSPEYNDAPPSKT